MTADSLSWTRQYLKRAGALLFVLVLLLSMAAPIFSDCHADEVDHNACSTVHGCCLVNVPALASTSTTAPNLITLNSSFLAGEWPSTGITISDAPFQPPRT
jgi:hypothetical protein